MQKDERPYLSCFAPAYWRSARAQLKSIRSLALAGLVCALAIQLQAMGILLIGTTLKMYFSFLVVSVGAFVYGPLVAMLAGVVIDTLGFIIASYGDPYFPGYLLTALLSGLVYGLALYRKRLTVARLAVLKFIVNFGLNVLLGSVWKAMLYGKGYYYYLTTGLVKNTVLLPVEVLLMVLVFRLLLPVLYRGGFVPRPPQESGKIPWI